MAVRETFAVRHLVVVVVAAVAAGACSYTPPEIDVAPPATAESSKIYAADGSLLTTLHAEENRENVALDDLPRHLHDAVLAIEDARFFEHKGVDVKAVLRAAVTNTAEGDVVEGGSTITQQYVKNTILGPERTFERKIEEALLAVQMERRYTKERILELYLNTIYFGNGAYGVQAAAHEYFGVDASELTLPQSALLAGLIRAPSQTDPYDRPDAATTRRNLVLRRMASLGWVDDAVTDAAREEPLGLAEAADVPRYPAPHLVEKVKRFVLDDPRFGETPGERQGLLFGGGLRIQTTIDLELQAQAEDAIAKVLSDPGRDPDAAVLALEPATGFVRAMVGGKDFFGGGAQAKVDLATGGNGRPAGSSFKPLVLAGALEKGVSLDKVYAAPPKISIPLPDGPWEPQNYEGSGGGEASLFEATVRSYNTVYAQLIMEVGPQEAVTTAARLGVLSPLDPYPSAVLGTNLVRPLDMAAAFATFANRGTRVRPTFVTKITRSDGTILYQHRHEQERVLDRRIADQVNGVLQAAVERGTGTRAKIGRPVAGKTGTGQEWRDAWFVGYTPDLVAAVWTGFAEEGKRSMVPPTTRIRVTGGSWPAQIWQLFMTAALAEVPVTPFAEPEALPELPPETGPDPVDPSTLPRVPDIVGMPAAQAEEMLRRQGFVVERQETPSDEYPPGYVASQSPRAGSRVPAGSAVLISIANGSVESAPVPDVLAMDEARAVRVIEDAGFIARVVREQEPPAPGAGRRTGLVWKQSPAGATRRAVGTTVTIWVNPDGGRGSG
jgi:penicillin-binding protein 1A